MDWCQGFDGRKNRRTEIKGWLLAFAFCITLQSGLAQSGDIESDIAPFTSSPTALIRYSNAVTAPVGADIEVLDVRETFHFDANGGYVWSRYTMYRVITQAGADDWNDLSVDWAPWRDQRPTLRARVVEPNGQEFSLDPSTLTDSPVEHSDSDIYSDERTLRAPLPAVSPGVVIETLLEVKTGPSLSGAGDVMRRYLQMSQPVNHFLLTLIAPRTVPLQYELERLPSMQPQVSTLDDQVQWTFEHGPMAAYEDTEQGLPRDIPSYPSVVFSTGASWQALAEAYSSTVDERITKSNVHPLAVQIVAGSSTREEKIAALMTYLNRGIRYTGIEFDETSVIPHTPKETLEHRYGDCKDKATLLVALLRSIGIPAYVALLDAGGRMDVPPHLAGLGMFDHAIVYVPGAPEYWIDATDDHARLGEIPLRDHGRLSLVASPQSTELVRIPWATSSDNTDIEERVVTLADYGPARVVETSRPGGSEESNYRELYSDLTNKATKDNLSDYFKKEYNAESLDKLDRTDPKDFSKPFILTLSGSKASRGYTGLRDSVLYIPIAGLFSKVPKALKTREATDKEKAAATRIRKERVTDYETAGPFVTEWQYRIVPPDGFSPAALPKDSIADLGPLKFSQHFSNVEGGVVEVTLRAEMDQQRLTPAEQKSLRDGLTAVLDAGSPKIKFDLTAHLLATQGHGREAFLAYRELVRKRPKDAVSHLRRADALLDAGMGEAARKEARLATQLDSHSALAQERLAEALKHDLVGRYMRPGADLAGAAAAYRTAIALDPTDKSLVVDLAILLEYNSREIRYGSGAHLKDALAEYRKLTSVELQQQGVAPNLPFLLFHDQQFAEARAAAVMLAKPPEQLIIACDAVLGGAESALQEARRRASNDDQMSDTLREAGNLLMSMRRYALAADLMEAGAAGSNATQILNLAAMLRRTTRTEDFVLTDSPEAFLHQVMITSLSPDLTEEKARTLDSINAIKADPVYTPKERESLLLASRTTLRAAATSGIQPEALLDIGVQATQIKISGSDALGYAVNMAAPSQPRQEMIFVREQGKLKILAIASQPAPVGLEVIDRVEKGDLLGARALLDWVRDGATASAADDPYAGTAFSHIWLDGQKDDDRQSVVLAAASLLAQSEHTTSNAVSILEALRKTETREAELTKIDLALLSAYVVSRSHERAAQTASILAAKSMNSSSIFVLQVRELCLANRCEEAEQLARARVASRKSDLSAQRALGSALVHQGRYQEAYKIFREVTEDPKAEAGDYNTLAWSTLFFEPPGGPDLDSAQRAVQMSPNSFGALHTLACVYAELGRSKEARGVLLQALDARSEDEPDGNSWYALGRIAEQYGEDELALADYGKVPPPDDGKNFEGSTYRLALSRMAALKTADGMSRSVGR